MLYDLHNYISYYTSLRSRAIRRLVDLAYAFYASPAANLIVHPSIFAIEKGNDQVAAVFLVRVQLFWCHVFIRVVCAVAFLFA